MELKDSRGWTIIQRVLALGLLGGLFGRGQVAAQGASLAQLTDPRTVAIPVQNLASDEFRLTSVGGYWVYVPPTCMGQRCPLFIVLSNRHFPYHLIPGADKYGIIVLLTGDGFAGSSGRRALKRGERDPLTTEFDTALQEVYRRFAIEPDKIALLGRCGTTGGAAFYGYHNAKLFSRVVMSSGGGVSQGETWANPATEFLYIFGLQEATYLAKNRLSRDVLRRRGFRVTQALGFRGHSNQVEEYTFIMRWLHQSWGPPAARLAPVMVADPPLPRLTTEVLAKMTAFWKQFQEAPYWLRTERRRQHQRVVLLPVGDESISIGMVDVGAMAVHYGQVRNWL